LLAWGSSELGLRDFDKSVMVIARMCREALGYQSQMRALWNCYTSLTRLEWQVLALVAVGLLNKQVVANSELVR